MHLVNHHEHPFPRVLHPVRVLCASGLLMIAASACSLLSPDRGGIGGGAPMSDTTKVTARVDTLPGRGTAGQQPVPYRDWVDSVLAGLTWRQRVAQLLVPFAYSDLTAKTMGRMRIAVGHRGVGGVLISRGSVSDARALIDSMQRWAQVPLLISADFENGPGMRLTEALRFPSMMAMAATRNTDLVYSAGVAVAEASREIGVLQNYAPVADVNGNPRNPIINTRSFGERPALVADMAEAYMRGLQDGGMIATAKHFPGHGDTHIDSHSGLPLIESDSAKLDSIDLAPFRRLIDAGVRAVMSGHLAVPALTGDSTLPATLTAAVMDTLLRGRLGFRGLIVTDAMNMKALTRTGIANLPAAAMRAGADILLVPGDIDETIDSVTAAVARGELDSARVLQSVRRMLEAKQWALDGDRAPDTASGSAARHRALAARIAEQALTMLRNSNGLLPLSDSSRIALVSFVRKGVPDEVHEFIERMRGRFPRLRSLIVDMRGSRDLRSWLRDSLKGVDVVVIAVNLSSIGGSGGTGLSDAQIAFSDLIIESTLPTAAVSFGTPYVLTAIPKADALLCSYGDDVASLEAAVQGLAGDIAPRGQLPVTIPGIAEFGTSLTYPDRKAVRDISPGPFFRIVDSLIRDQIARHATPGAQLAVLHGDSLLYLRSYGKLSYDNAALPVNDSTLYDCASLTKVIATTTVAMQFVDQGRLHLDSTVAGYLPEFGVHGKERITVRNLLLHNSGLEAFRPFAQQATTAREVLDSIYASVPVYGTGNRTVYSDLGMIVLAKVLERIDGRTLDAYARDELFLPLGMHHTLFTPADSLHALCAPTEIDRIWRGKLVQGSVHDETAALLGGVAGHAGLFSTAADLARFARMMMRGGNVDGRRYVQPQTVQAFTERTAEGRGRALGWDLRSHAGSSTGRYFSSRSFGHTGFTGTSIWIDPAADIAVILLTNRVHPTRENRQLVRFRAVLHDAVREAIMNGDSAGE